MRVLLSTYGSRGDVEPVAALAVQLQALGAEVVVCAPPDEEFAELLAGVGVPVVPVGRSARDLTKAAPPPSPHHRPLAYGGRPFPPDVTDHRTLWELDAESNNALFGEALNSHRASVGLPPVENVRDYVIGDRPWLATDPVLDPWLEPADLDVVQTGAWILPDGRPLPDDLEACLDAGAAPVFAGFGSMPLREATDAAQVAIEAARAMGRRVIIRRGWPDLALIDDQDDCFAVGEVNQQKLFPRVAAVVHHGGAGTTTTATRSGTPQVVVPQATDQPYWADRVVAFGIGVAHDGPVPTVDSLSAALRTALAPETAAQATAVAASIRTDGAAVAAQMLVDLVKAATDDRQALASDRRS